MGGEVAGGGVGKTTSKITLLLFSCVSSLAYLPLLFSLTSASLLNVHFFCFLHSFLFHLTLSFCVTSPALIHSPVPPLSKPPISSSFPSIPISRSREEFYIRERQINPPPPLKKEKNEKLPLCTQSAPPPFIATTFYSPNPNHTTTVVISSYLSPPNLLWLKTISSHLQFLLTTRTPLPPRASSAPLPFSKKTPYSSKNSKITPHAAQTPPKTHKCRRVGSGWRCKCCH